MATREGETSNLQNETGVDGASLRKGGRAGGCAGRSLLCGENIGGRGPLGPRGEVDEDERRPFSFVARPNLCARHPILTLPHKGPTRGGGEFLRPPAAKKCNKNRPRVKAHSAVNQTTISSAHPTPPPKGGRACGRATVSRQRPPSRRLCWRRRTAAELSLHLAELLALGLAPPDRPGNAQDADHADDVEPDEPLTQR